MTSMPPAMGSISPAVKGWSMATASSRSSGWWNSLHSTRRSGPGAALRGRKGPPLSAIGISSGCKVGPRTGFPHDGSGAADMIRVAVSENQVLELARRTAKPADRPEYGGLLTGVTGVDQR